MKDASTRQRFLNNIEQAIIKIAHTAKVKGLKYKSTTESSGVRNLSKKTLPVLSSILRYTYNINSDKSQDGMAHDKKEGA